MAPATDHNYDDPNPQGSSSSEPSSRGLRGLRRALILMGALAMLVTGGSILVAAGASGGPWGHGGGGRHWGHGPGGDPELMRERVEFASAWILRRVDATDEQTQRIQGILGDAVSDVHDLAEPHRTYREQWLTLLSQDELDREALRELRRSELQIADAVTARMLEALADAAEELTPAQRAELLERVQRHHH